MRHVLYLLLVTNLVYLGWNLLQSNTGTTSESLLPPLPASVKPLVTLQESQQQSASPANATDSTSTSDAVVLDELTTAEPPGAGSLGNACKALGPFEIEDEVKAVAKRLDALGLQSRQRIAEVREENGYWVYLPSMAREAALEIARQMDAKGDKDYFIGKDNFISLGIYQDVARAEVRLRQVRKLGLDALLEVRYRTHDAYWLEFNDNARAAQEIAGIMSEKPGLQLHALACL
jgi:hypothetical protein